MRLGRPVGSGWLRGGWGGWDLIRSGGIGQDRGGGQLGLGSKVRGVRGIKVIKGISFSGGSICFLHEVAQGSKKCVGACYFSGGWIERFWEVAGGGPDK